MISETLYEYFEEQKYMLSLDIYDDYEVSKWYLNNPKKERIFLNSAEKKETILKELNALSPTRPTL